MFAGTGVRAGRAGVRSGVGDGRVWGVGVAFDGAAVFALADARGVGVTLGAGVGVIGTGHR